MEQNRIDRPAKVGTAVRLLYTTMGLIVLANIIDAAAFTRVVPIVTAMMTITFFEVGITWLLAYMIGKGRNWARIVLLILFIIAMPVSAVPLWQSLSTNPISGLIGIARLAMEILSLIFLFQKPSSDWFREIRLQRLEAQQVRPAG